MPRVNVYIRQDDWEKWRMIGNKSEFIHDSLWLNLKVIHHPKEVRTLLKKAGAAIAVCPVHQIPFANGKCLQKGCKWA